MNTFEWILSYFRWIGLELNANEEIIWENSDYGENILQGTRKIVRIIEVFQLQRLGLYKVNYKGSQGAYITGVEARSFAGKKFFDYVQNALSTSFL